MGSPPTPFLQIVKGSRDLFLEFWDPVHISGMIGARNFILHANFMHIDHLGINEKNAKLGQRWSVKGRHLTYF